MKSFTKIAYMMLLTVLVLCVSMVPAFAKTYTQHGLEATFITDKAEYTANEQINTTLKVTNTNNYKMNTVNLNAVVPEGYKLSDSSVDNKTFLTLEAGETVELNIEYISESSSASIEPSTEPETETVTEPTSATIATSTTTTNKATSDYSGVINTGSASNVVLLLVFLLASGVVFVFVKKKKIKQLLSVVLCVVIVGSAITVIPFTSAEATEIHTDIIELEETIIVDGETLKLNASVSYNYTIPELETTTYPPVTSLDEDDPDIEIYSFQASEYCIPVGETKTVTFTAEIFSNVVISENEVTVIDGNEEFVGYMYDDGTNGDQTADDGIYTLQIDLSQNSETEVNYYATVNGIVSENASIGYYVPSTDEELNNVAIADERISALLISDEYTSGTESQKVGLVSALLNELVEDNLVIADSVSYSEAQMMFLFKYANGMGGNVLLEERNPNINTSSTNNSSGATTDEVNLNVSQSTHTALVLNAFENNSYRRDYYENLELDWDNMGLSTTIDTYVTVDNLRNLNGYDVVVFAMHGSHSGSDSVLCLNETVSTATDRAYNFELTSSLTVQRVTYADGTQGYWVYSDFFTDNYTSTELSGQMIFSESCMFYGCDCTSTTPNSAYANALLNCGVDVVVGYHNSVGADYSRDVMKDVIEDSFNNRATIREALDNAIDEHGENDNWEDAPSHKYIAFPNISGNENYVLGDSGTVSGRVMNAADNSAIENALVRIYRNNWLIESARTDSNGDYRIDSITPGNYIVKITAGGYKSIRFAVTVLDNEVTYNATTMLMKVSGIVSNEANGIVKNSITAEGVGDVTIKMRKNWNNTTGTVLYTTTTNENGYYNINYDTGFYTLELSKDGFTTNYKNIIIGLSAFASQDVTISPILTEGTYRIVLTWGENPRDLDSHVTGTLSNGNNFHVYYMNKFEYDGDVEVCNLDVDDITSYGPETITLIPTTTDSYYYYIHHYAGSESIATSNAQINLYNGDQLVRTFHAPTNQGTEIFWNVFAIKNGELIVNNTITSSPNTSYAD